MKLCIAEKPSVAREIAYILGARARKDGYLEGNGYCVTWTFGHLCTLKEPDDYQVDWKKWSLHTLPILPDKFDTKLISNKGSKKQFGVIKKLLKQAKVVINCGDAGQEGELIQRWVLQQAKYRGKVQRLWISSLTPEAIRDGFQQLRDASAFDSLYHAGRSRAIGDWLLGMNATRLYTLKYGGYKQVLSVGRVQTPTLAMLVERHKEIEDFVPTTYWELETLYRETIFQCEKGRFLKKEEGQSILKQVQGQTFTILSSERKKGKEYPPNLFDLTSLQVNANKRFGFTADKTLKIVQKLYEQKLVTYPRVDTVYLPNDQYPKIAGILGKLSQYAPFTQPLLGKTIRKSGKVFNDKKVTDHHAIIPTGQEKSLPLDEQRIYDAVTRRFIAAFYPDCIVAKTTVIGEAADIRFKATGKEVLEPGWRVLYPKPPARTSKPNKTKKDKEEEKILPNFTKGEQGPHQPKLAEKQTTPPKNYTEATLLRAMETAGKKVDDKDLRELMKANGIGRPATRANIIETLFRRKYIKRQKKLILPTEMGVQLIDTIQNDLLKSAELTGQWEKQLREIEDGAHTAESFIGDMQQMVTGLVTEVKQDASATRLSMPQRGTGKKWQKKRPKKSATKSSSRSKSTTADGGLTEQSCPKCRKGKLLKGKTAYGCSRWREGCGFRLPFAYAEKSISEKQLFRLLQKGSTIQLKGFQLNGHKQAGRLRFNDAYELVFEPKGQSQTPVKKVTPQTAKKPIRKVKTSSEKPKCPKCGIGKIIRGKTAYGCSNWQTGCSFRFSFEELRRIAAGRALTKELVLEILKRN